MQVSPRTGSAHELLEPAEQMCWRVPELALVFGDRAVALARRTGDRGARLQAEALAIFCSNRLGRGVAVTHRALTAVRDAEAAGDEEVGGRLRVELAWCARAADSHEVAVRVLRPVLRRERIEPAVRAHALLAMAASLPASRQHVERLDALDEAERLYESIGLARDELRLVRARVRAARAGHHRRQGEFDKAVEVVDQGLDQLDRLGDPDADSGEHRARLVLERVHALFELGRRAEAVRVADAVLSRPVRAAAAGPVGWLGLAISTRVHLPEDDHDAAVRVLNDTAAIADRHKQDAVLTEAFNALSQAHERCEDFPAALTALRSAYAADRRWRAAVHSARVRLLEAFPALADDAAVTALAAVVGGTARAAEQPAAVPTAEPGAEPTATPAAELSTSPGVKPSATSGVDPSTAFGVELTATPGVEQAATPGAELSAAPGAKPTAVPGVEPAAASGVERSAASGAEPSAVPGAGPTAVPGVEPTAASRAEPTAALAADDQREADASADESPATAPEAAGYVPAGAAADDARTGVSGGGAHDAASVARAEAAAAVQSGTRAARAAHASNRGERGAARPRPEVPGPRGGSDSAVGSKHDLPAPGGRGTVEYEVRGAWTPEPARGGGRRRAEPDETHADPDTAGSAAGGRRRVDRSPEVPQAWPEAVEPAGSDRSRAAWPEEAHPESGAVDPAASGRRRADRSEVPQARSEVAESAARGRRRAAEPDPATDTRGPGHDTGRAARRATPADDAAEGGERLPGRVDDLAEHAWPTAEGRSREPVDEQAWPEELPAEAPGRRRSPADQTPADQPGDPVMSPWTSGRRGSGDEPAAAPPEDQPGGRRARSTSESTSRYGAGNAADVEASGGRHGRERAAAAPGRAAGRHGAAARSEAFGDAASRGSGAEGVPGYVLGEASEPGVRPAAGEPSPGSRRGTGDAEVAGTAGTWDRGAAWPPDEDVAERSPGRHGDDAGGAEAAAAWEQGSSDAAVGQGRARRRRADVEAPSWTPGAVEGAGSHSAAGGSAGVGEPWGHVRPSAAEDFAPSGRHDAEAAAGPGWDLGGAWPSEVRPEPAKSAWPEADEPARGRHGTAEWAADAGRHGAPAGEEPGEVDDFGLSRSDLSVRDAARRLMETLTGRPEIFRDAVGGARRTEAAREPFPEPDAVPEVTGPVPEPEPTGAWPGEDRSAEPDDRRPERDTADVTTIMPVIAVPPEPDVAPSDPPDEQRFRAEEPEGGRRSRGRSLSEIRASLALSEQERSGQRHSRSGTEEPPEDGEPARAGEAPELVAEQRPDWQAAEQGDVVDLPTGEPGAEVGLAELLTEALMAYETGRRGEDAEHGRAPGRHGSTRSSTSDPRGADARHRWPGFGSTAPNPPT
ncbi:hypothetical protein [Saccharopolyspora cebuensis]|uniref:hypothetical protein n=1 Tax=Saccharopolyspora cebuensis TaxID=418759 RepID=UPI0031E9672E